MFTIWAHVDDFGISDDKQEKAENMKLLLAFAIAIKHHLRSEPGTHWPDLEDLIPEKFQKKTNTVKNDTSFPLPLEILFHLH